MTKVKLFQLSRYEEFYLSTQAAAAQIDFGHGLHPKRLTSHWRVP